MEDFKVWIPFLGTLLFVFLGPKMFEYFFNKNARELKDVIEIEQGLAELKIESKDSKEILEHHLERFTVARKKKYKIGEFSKNSFSLENLFFNALEWLTGTSYVIAVISVITILLSLLPNF